MRILVLLLIACTAALGAVEGAQRAALQDELDQIADSLKLPRAFNLIHRLVGPSVVSIHTSEKMVVSRWGRGFEEREVDMGEGSGFVFHVDGDASFILTNAHVVIRVDRDKRFIRDRRTGEAMWYDGIQVSTTDGRMYRAVPVGADPQTDLAVLKLETGGLEPVRWADSDEVAVGDFVLALGYPLGIGYSATSGIISATAKATGIYGDRGYESFLQTDAAINPGNSGGPLVDLHGRVLGVNANIVSRGGGNVGIGFAIPANLARRVALDLLDDGRVSRPMVGIQMDELDRAQADQIGIDARNPVLVTLVLPGSPAERAGMLDRDVIIAINGRPLAGIHQFRSRIAAAGIGDELRFRVWRAGEEFDLVVVPEAEEDLRERLKRLSLENAAPDEVRWPGYGLILGRDEHRGALIRSVVEGGPASRAGLLAGDRILKIYEHGVVAELESIAGLDAQEQLVMEVFHRGRLYVVRLRRE